MDDTKGVRKLSLFWEQTPWLLFRAISQSCFSTLFPGIWEPMGEQTGNQDSRDYGLDPGAAGSSPAFLLAAGLGQTLKLSEPQFLPLKRKEDAEWKEVP